MVEKREKIAKDLGIPVEDASKMLVEKQKSVLISEAKFHSKSLVSIMDKLKDYDSDLAEKKAKETIKFLIARNSSPEDIKEISEYADNVCDNMLDKDFFNDISD
ncbi:MAG: hypothetical protein ACQER9_03660 [Nanobdellota archaeon]